MGKRSMRSINWVEAKHPRDDRGRFAKKGSPKWFAKALTSAVRRSDAAFGDMHMGPRSGEEPKGRLPGGLIDIKALSKAAPRTDVTMMANTQLDKPRDVRQPGGMTTPSERVSDANRKYHEREIERLNQRLEDAKGAASRAKAARADKGGRIQSASEEKANRRVAEVRDQIRMHEIARDGGPSIAEQRIEADRARQAAADARTAERKARMAQQAEAERAHAELTGRIGGPHHSTLYERLGNGLSEEEMRKARAAQDERIAQEQARSAESQRQYNEMRAGRTDRENLEADLQTLKDRRDFMHRSGRMDDRKISLEIKGLQDKLEAMNVADRKAKIKEMGVKKGDKVKNSLGEYEVNNVTKDGYLRIRRPDGKLGGYVDPMKAEKVEPTPGPSLADSGIERARAQSAAVQAGLRPEGEVNAKVSAGRQRLTANVNRVAQNERLTANANSKKFGEADDRSTVEGLDTYAERLRAAGLHAAAANLDEGDLNGAAEKIEQATRPGGTLSRLPIEQRTEVRSMASELRTKLRSGLGLDRTDKTFPMPTTKTGRIDSREARADVRAKEGRAAGSPALKQGPAGSATGGDVDSRFEAVKAQVIATTPPAAHASLDKIKTRAQKERFLAEYNQTAANSRAIDQAVNPGVTTTAGGRMPDGANDERIRRNASEFGRGSLAGPSRSNTPASNVNEVRSGRLPGGVTRLDTSRATRDSGDMTNANTTPGGGTPTLGVTESSRGRTTTVTLPNGKTAQRTSKTKAYTHAVVSTTDNYAVAQHLEADTARREQHLAAYDQWRAQGGDLRQLKAYPASSLSYNDQEEQRRTGKKFMDYYLPDFEPVQKTVRGRMGMSGSSYWADEQGFRIASDKYGTYELDIQHMRDRVNKQRAKAQELRNGPQYSYGVARWSQSAENALKGVSEFQTYTSPEMRATSYQVITVGGQAVHKGK